MKVKIPKDYITYDNRTIDKGSFIICGDQYKFPRHIIVKDWVKQFDSKEEKIKWRQEQFWNLRYHAWYKRKFKDRKGRIVKSENFITDYIMEFIRQTVDCDHNEYALACRAMIYDPQALEVLGKANIPNVNEMLMCVMVSIRHDEEGIVSLPFDIAQKDMPRIIEKAHRDRADRIRQIEYQKTIV